MKKPFKRISTFTRHTIDLDDFKKMIGLKKSDTIENIEMLSHVEYLEDGLSRKETIEITLEENIESKR